MSPRLAYRRAAAVVAREHGLPVAQVLHPKGRAARQARHAAAYLAHVRHGLSTYQLAAVAGVTRRALRVALAACEDARDNPDIDRRLTTLEERLTCTP